MPAHSQTFAGQVGNDQNPLFAYTESSGFEAKNSDSQKSGVSTFERLSCGNGAQTSTYILRTRDGEVKFSLNGCYAVESEIEALNSIHKILAGHLVRIAGPTERESRLAAELSKVKAELAESKAKYSALVNKVKAEAEAKAEARHAAEIARVRAEAEARHSAEIARLRAEADAKAAELQNQLDAIRATGHAGEAADQAHEYDIEQLRMQRDKAIKELEELKLKSGNPKATPNNSSLPGGKSIAGGNRKGRTRTKTTDADAPQEDPDKPKPKPKPKRKSGGQPGHDPNNRQPLEPDVVKVYKPESTICEDCGCEMNHVEGADVVFQQVEIPTPPPIVTDHVAQTFACPNCRNTSKGEIPPEIEKQGVFGPNLVAFIVSLKMLAVSYRKIKDLLHQWKSIDISVGGLVNLFVKHSKALEDANQEIEGEIKKQEIVNIDETSHREKGRRLYTWVFVTMKALLYRISSRGRDMLDRVLGPDFVGIIGCDYYGAYISYAADKAGVKLQTCLAHLKRDFQNCFEHLDPEISQYGKKMLDVLDGLFKAWHAYKADPSPVNLEELRRWGETLNREAKIAPDKGKPKAIAKRFVKTPGSYTQFINSPGVEPTNNASERAIRPLVVQRVITQGTRGERGRLALERYWSVMGTCKNRGLSFIDFFKSSMAAHVAGRKPPSIFD